MKFSIHITDEQTLLEIDAERLQAIAADLLRHEAVAAAEISIALVDGAVMRRLNKQHLGHDYDTDVLSFLLEESGGADKLQPDLPGADKALEGEVVISATVAAQAAADFHWSGADEVLLYAVHGLLHLCGYDDLTEAEQAVMRQRERAHLARWNLTPVYAEDEGLSADDAGDGYGAGCCAEGDDEFIPDSGGTLRDSLKESQA